MFGANGKNGGRSDCGGQRSDPQRLGQRLPRKLQSRIRGGIPSRIPPWAADGDATPQFRADVSHPLRRRINRPDPRYDRFQASFHAPHRRGVPPRIHLPDQPLRRRREPRRTAHRPLPLGTPPLLVPVPSRINPRPNLRRRLSGHRGRLLRLRKPRRTRKPDRRLPVPGRAHRTDQPAAVVQLRMEFRPLVRMETLRRRREPPQQDDGFEDERLSQRRFLPQLARHARGGLHGGLEPHALLQRQHQIPQRGTQRRGTARGPNLQFRTEVGRNGPADGLPRIPAPFQLRPHVLRLVAAQRHRSGRQAVCRAGCLHGSGIQLRLDV